MVSRGGAQGGQLLQPGLNNPMVVVAARPAVLKSATQLLMEQEERRAAASAAAAFAADFGSTSKARSKVQQVRFKDLSEGTAFRLQGTDGSGDSIPGTPATSRTRLLQSGVQGWPGEPGCPLRSMAIQTSPLNRRHIPSGQQTKATWRRPGRFARARSENVEVALVHRSADGDDGSPLRSAPSPSPVPDCTSNTNAERTLECKDQPGHEMEGGSCKSGDLNSKDSKPQLGPTEIAEVMLQRISAITSQLLKAPQELSTGNGSLSKALQETSNTTMAASPECDSTLTNTFRDTDKSCFVVSRNSGGDLSTNSTPLVNKNDQQAIKGAKSNPEVRLPDSTDPKASKNSTCSASNASHEATSSFMLLSSTKGLPGDTISKMMKVQMKDSDMEDGKQTEVLQAWDSKAKYRAIMHDSKRARETSGDTVDAQSNTAFKTKNVEDLQEEETGGTGSGQEEADRRVNPWEGAEEGVEELREKLRMVEEILRASQETIKLLLSVIQELERNQAQREGRSYRSAQDTSNCKTCRKSACIIYSVEHDFKIQEDKLFHQLKPEDTCTLQQPLPGEPIELPPPAPSNSPPPRQCDDSPEQRRSSKSQQQTPARKDDDDASIAVAVKIAG
uniref:INSYN2B protein-like n=1 Tax=Myxine glutinosa TaxID=7769 RepID=UPI00358FE8B6